MKGVGGENMKTLKDVDMAAAAALKQASAKYATKQCNRCDGMGFATVFSASRGHWSGPPGKKVCFKCGGSGSVIASKADREALAKDAATIEVERLRGTWLVTRDELRALEGQTGWAAEHGIKLLRAKLVQLEAHGKAAKAVAA